MWRAPGQLAEERVGSAEYTVWTCAGCGHRLIERDAATFSLHDACPECTFVTLGKTEHVTSASTPSTEGTATVLEQCANCGFVRESTRRLPKKIESSRRSGDADVGGGGSGFGGGSSGGGGASRSY